MASDEGNWGTPIIALTAFFLVLVLLFLFLRIATRVWIVRSFWWDDFAIILAVVTSQSHRVNLVTHKAIARNHNWRGPRLCRSQLRIRQTPTIPHALPPARVQKIHVWRMDPDIRDLDVDESLHMSLPDANTT